MIFFFFFFLGGGGGYGEGEGEERQHNTPLYQLKISYLHESLTFFFFWEGGGAVAITPFAPPPPGFAIAKSERWRSKHWLVYMYTNSLLSTLCSPLSSRLLCVKEADPGGGQTGHMSVTYSLLPPGAQTVRP